MKPPLYIIEKLRELDKKKIDKIPTNIIADYLNLGTSKKAFQYINELRQEIKEITYVAREHFQKNPQPIPA